MIFSPPWYKVSPRKLEFERSVVQAIDYFRLEEEQFDEQKRLVVTGTLSYCQLRSGKKERFRVRLEYPAEFPKHWQSVFDHDKRFSPSADGHLLSNHQVCLTYPDRKELSVGSDYLTEEVLGAALVWFNKRLIYDRTGNWPGQAERHGALAKIDLVLERSGLDRNPAVVAWADQLYLSTLTNGGHAFVDVYDLCPCDSGRKLKFCCYEALRPVLKLIRSAPRRSLEHKGA